MPWAIKVPCRGCGRPVVKGYCDSCTDAGKGKVVRQTSAQRGYGHRWRKQSKAFLDDHPLCAGYPIGAHGERAVTAECVDHIVAHKGDMDLFWDQDNWQPLCLGCNSRKAATEEGGFGHP